MKYFYILIICFLPTICNSQTFEKYKGVTLGFDNFLLQGGYSFGNYQDFESEKKAILLDYNLKTNQTGLTFSYSYGMFLVLGADIGFLYYRKFDSYVKPKIGIGFPCLFNINYGYNVYLGETKNRGMISFELNIILKRKPMGQNGKMLFGLLK